MNLVVDKLLLMDRGTRVTIEQFLNNVFNIFRILCEELNQCECYYQKYTARPIVDRFISLESFLYNQALKSWQDGFGVFLVLTYDKYWEKCYLQHSKYRAVKATALATLNETLLTLFIIGSTKNIAKHHTDA